jgi:hypothetical protein
VIDTRELLEVVCESPLTLRLWTRDDRGEPREVSGGGYAPHDLTRRDWVVGAGEAETEHTFRFAGRAGPVHGYWITRPSGRVLDEEAFADGPYQVEVGGSEIMVEAVLEAEALG